MKRVHGETIWRSSAQVIFIVLALFGLSAGVALAGANGVPNQPMGVINVFVTNSTTGSIINGSNNMTSAQPVFPGDTLVFSVQVTNQAFGTDDTMANTVITNSLPSGLTLVSQDNLNIGNISPNDSATRTITVTVDSSATGTIDNQVCFTGAAVDGSNQQSGCNSTFIRMVSSSGSSTGGAGSGATSTPPPVPSGSGNTVPPPNTVPDTGGSLTGSSLGVAGIITASIAYIRSRRRK